MAGSAGGAGGLLLGIGGAGGSGGTVSYIPVGGEPDGVAVNPGGDVYVASYLSSEVAVISA